jgi:hypothetical protein
MVNSLYGGYAGGAMKKIERLLEFSSKRDVEGN